MYLAYKGVGESIAVKNYGRLLDQIKAMGGKADHSVLLQRNYYHFGDTENFKKCIQLLEDTGRIKTMVGKSGKRTYVLIKEKEV